VVAVLVVVVVVVVVVAVVVVVVGVVVSFFVATPLCSEGVAVSATAVWTFLAACDLIRRRGTRDAQAQQIPAQIQVEEHAALLVHAAPRAMQSQKQQYDR